MNKTKKQAKTHRQIIAWWLLEGEWGEVEQS